MKNSLSKLSKFNIVLVSIISIFLSFQSCGRDHVRTVDVFCKTLDDHDLFSFNTARIHTLDTINEEYIIKIRPGMTEETCECELILNDNKTRYELKIKTSIYSLEHDSISINISDTGSLFYEESEPYTPSGPNYRKDLKCQFISDNLPSSDLISYTQSCDDSVFLYSRKISETDSIAFWFENKM